MKHPMTRVEEQDDNARFGTDPDLTAPEAVERLARHTEDASGYLEGWNDAREAAATACENIRGLGFVDASVTGPMPIGRAIGQIIRALTPPERPKP